MKINEIRKNKLIEDFKARNINLSEIDFKYISIDFYAKKKVNLTYAKLIKPKISYYLVKGNSIIVINKTIYYHLTDITEDTESLKVSLFSNVDDGLYNRFKGKDYKHLNFLNNKEKSIIFFAECFYNDDFIKCIDILDGVY